MIRIAPILVVLALLLPGAALAQDLDALMNQTAGGVGRNSILIFTALTVLSLAPAIAITVTCFPFIVTVLSILRQSLGLQQSPPNMLIISMSVFLTWFVMDPVLRDFWQVAGQPLRDGTIGFDEAFERGIVPFRLFMEGRVDPDTLDRISALVPDDRAPDSLSVLVPSFMLSEIERAFQIGFLVALPFLIIDLVVSAVLMSMGMMMLPPAVVSLPFKLAFFVVVDGWSLLASALVRGYQ